MSSLGAPSSFLLLVAMPGAPSSVRSLLVGLSFRTGLRFSKLGNWAVHRQDVWQMCCDMGCVLVTNLRLRYSVTFLKCTLSSFWIYTVHSLWDPKLTF